MSLPINLPPGYTKTDIETRYSQEVKANDRLGPVLTPIMSWQVQGDDGQTHTIRVVGCYYRRFS